MSCWVQKRTTKVTSDQHRKAVKLSRGGVKVQQDSLSSYTFVMPLFSSCSSVWLWLRSRQSLAAASARCSIFCCNPLMCEPPCRGPSGLKLEYPGMNGEA